ncbi:MAG: hypothetical protein ABIN36_05790 [Ferruginibacter sp.]
MNKIKYLSIHSAFVTLVLCFPGHCFSQDKADAPVTNVTKITFINPGASYEKSIAKKQTLYIQAFMNLSGSFEYSSTYGSSSTIFFDPAFTFQYRYYYGLKRRDRKGARTAMNSANYLSAIYENVFSKRSISNSYYIEDRRRAVNTVGVVWGMQRNYQRRFSLDLNIGAGYLFTRSTLPYSSWQTAKEHSGQFTIPGQVNLGIWLNKKV